MKNFQTTHRGELTFGFIGVDLYTDIDMNYKSMHKNKTLDLNTAGGLFKIGHLAQCQLQIQIIHF